jgi:prepilin-type processing-associated H-X9-DG protein
MNRSRSRPLAAFTRLDVLATLASLGLLAFLALPSIGQSPQSRVQMCVDNLRRLSAAWILYAEDHQGILPSNQSTTLQPSWAMGWMDWSANSDNTNTLILTDPSRTLITPYVQSDPKVFKCPADRYLSPTQIDAGWSQRTRSYSMNGFIASTQGESSNDLRKEYRHYQAMHDFRQKGPANLIVFLEEHPDSINDGTLYGPRSTDTWIDYPGAFHDGATSFAWGDGHVTRHRWKHRSMYREVVHQWDNFHMNAGPNHPDLFWYLEVCSERRNP